MKANIGGVDRILRAVLGPCALTARPKPTRVKRRSSFHHRSRAPVGVDVSALEITMVG